MGTTRHSTGSGVLAASALLIASMTQAQIEVGDASRAGRTEPVLRYPSTPDGLKDAPAAQAPGTAILANPITGAFGTWPANPWDPIRIITDTAIDEIPNRGEEPEDRVVTATANDIDGLRLATSSLQPDARPVGGHLTRDLRPGPPWPVSLTHQREATARHQTPPRSRDERFTEALMAFDKVLAHESNIIISLAAKSSIRCDDSDPERHDQFEQFRAAVRSCVGRCASAVPNHAGAAPPNIDAAWWDELQRAVVEWKRDLFTFRQHIAGATAFRPDWASAIVGRLSDYRAKVRGLLTPTSAPKRQRLPAAPPSKGNGKGRGGDGAGS